MIAAQMGDTQYRGRIIWMLLTARPDLLPIDLKRQGRAEVHIPLFYPTDESEIRQMFVILAKKLGSRVAVEDVPPIPQRGQLSGADIEGIVGRAWRTSLLAGADHVTREALAEVVAQFMPSTQGLERELQETAAILECTDRQFLPPAILEKMAAEGGRAKLQARLTALKQIVAGEIARSARLRRPGAARRIRRHRGTDELVRRQGGTPGDPGTASRSWSRSRARSPTASSRSRSWTARSSGWSAAMKQLEAAAERRPAREGDDRARRADRLQRDAAAARAAGRAGADGVRQRLSAQRRH